MHLNKQLGKPADGWIGCTCVQAGCTAAESAPDAIKASNVIVVVLSDAAAIHSTVLAEDTLPLLPGKCIVQMGTIGPDESRSISAAVHAAGGQYVEAPVLGSQPEAAAGTLLVMVGCNEAPEGTPAWPVLQAFGEAPLHIGEVPFHILRLLSMCHVPVKPNGHGPGVSQRTQSR